MAKTAKAANTDQVVQDQTDDEQLEGVLEFSEDISSAEKPPALPVGEYNATIMDVIRGRGKESNRPYIMIKWRIDANDMPADYVEQLKIDDLTLSSIHMICEDNPKSRFAARQLCERIGSPMGRSINFAEWKGLEGKIKVKHGKDLDGNPREEVAGVVKR